MDERNDAGVGQDQEKELTVEDLDAVAGGSEVEEVDDGVKIGETSRGSRDVEL